MSIDRKQGLLQSLHPSGLSTISCQDLILQNIEPSNIPIPCCSVPPTGVGAWRIEKRWVDQTAADQGNSHDQLLHMGFRRLPLGPGLFTVLRHFNKLVMSDHLEHRLELCEPYLHAHGRVLLNGLGMGLLLDAILGTRAFVRFGTSILVTEIAPEVIQMVAEPLLVKHFGSFRRRYRTEGPSVYAEKFGLRAEVICTDATKIPILGHFDMIWHDIWTDYRPENFDEMRMMLRRWRHKVSGFHGCWGYETHRSLRRRWGKTWQRRPEWPKKSPKLSG